MAMVKYRRVLANKSIEAERINMDLKTIIREMKNGNFKNYVEFYNITSGYVSVIIHNIIGDSLYVDGVFTDIYNAIYKYINSAPDGVGFLQWMGKVVTIKAYEFVKENSDDAGTDNVTYTMKGDGSQDGLTIFIPEVALSDNDFQKKVFSTVMNGDLEHKTVFFLYYISGFSDQNIASSIHINVEKVKHIVGDIHNALKDMVMSVYGTNTKTMLQLDIRHVFWSMFVNGYRYILSDIPENMLMYGKSDGTFKSMVAGAAAGGVSGAGAVIIGGVKSTVPGIGANSSPGIGTAGAGLKGDLVKNTGIGRTGIRPDIKSAADDAKGAFKGIEVADAGAGKFASSEHIAKRVAEVSVDAASKGFFGTVAGKATVALASLAVAGGICGGVFFYLGNKPKDDNNTDDKGKVAVTTEVVSSDTATDEDTTEEVTTEEIVESSDMYNVRIEMIPELYGDTEYVYIDGDKYGALKEAVEGDSQEFSPNKESGILGTDSILDYCSNRGEQWDTYSYDSFAQNLGTNKWVIVKRSDSRVLDLNYCNTTFGEPSYVSKKYDVETGNELTLTDLGILEDEFKNIIKERLTEEYSTNSRYSSLADSFGSDSVQKCIDCRVDKACEVLYHTYNTDFDEYSTDDKTVTLCDQIFFDMVHDGIVFNWNTAYTSGEMSDGITVFVPYSDFADFNEDYLPDDNTFSGEVDGTISIDVDSDGQANSIESMYNYDNSWSNAVVVNGTTLADDLGDISPKNRFVIKKSDGSCYMILTYASGSMYHYSFDEERTFYTYVYDLTSGEPKSLVDGTTNIRAICASGEYVFCQDVNTGEYGYYSISDDGLVYEPDAYTDDTALRRCYGLYSREIVRNSNMYAQFGLAYIDDDDIPELVMQDSWEVAPTAVYSFYNGRLVRQGVGHPLGGGYVEREGIFWGDSARSMISQIYIYSYSDGVFTELMHGQDTYLAEEIDGEYNYSKVYYINDTEATEQQYNDRINELIDPNKKKLFSDECKDDLDTMINKINQLY